MENWQPKISNVHWAYFDSEGNPLVEVTPDKGYPFLLIDFEDGTQAQIGFEQKLIRAGIDAVFLGIDFEDKVKFTIRPDGKNNVSEDDLVLKGVTDNESVVLLTKEFMAALEEGTFRPQTVLKNSSTLTDLEEEE